MMRTLLSKRRWDGAATTDAERHPMLSNLALFGKALLRDKVIAFALFFLLLTVVLAVFASSVTPYDPIRQNLGSRLLPPMASSPTDGPPHFFGTDSLGRDIFSRIIFGARISLFVGIASVSLSGVVGTILGLWAGYARGWADDIIMRLVDVQMGFPPLLLLLLVLYSVGSGLMNVVLVLAVVRWTIYARLVRSIVLDLREELFVEAARSIGAGSTRIVFRHLLPNLLSPILVLATLDYALVVLTEATLSFLGLGIQSPSISWGLMLSDGRAYLDSAWWLVMIPGLAILLITLSLNLLASWVRTISDTTLRWRWASKGS